METLVDVRSAQAIPSHAYPALLQEPPYVVGLSLSSPPQHVALYRGAEGRRGWGLPAGYLVLPHMHRMNSVFRVSPQSWQGLALERQRPPPAPSSAYLFLRVGLSGCVQDKHVFLLQYVKTKLICLVHAMSSLGAMFPEKVGGFMLLD